MLSDENISRVAQALYPVAFLLVLIPMMDLGIRTFPPQPGALQWRFAFAGQLLGSIGTMLLGVGLFTFFSALRGNRTGLRVIGYAAFVVAALIVALLVLFTLDALQMRQLVPVNAKRTVLLSSVGAGMAGVVGIVALISIGRGALAVSRGGSPAAARRTRPAASTLVVASQGSGDAV